MSYTVRHTAVRAQRARLRAIWMIAICTVALPLALLSTPSRAAAQGGMGGGIGGGMGGRGGGMGGRGGRGMGGDMGSRQSPVDAIKENLEHNDPLKFLLDHKKPLDLTKAQKDTIERYRNDMKDMQKPVYKDLERMAAEMPGRGGPGGGMGPPGGMGGERGGGGARGRGQGRGADADTTEAGGRGRGAPGGPFRELAAKLSDIQDAFRDRARAQLTAAQRTKADSLENAWLEAERKKAEEKREQQRRG